MTLLYLRFTSLAVVPDTIEGQRIYTDELQVAAAVEVSEDYIYRYEGNDTIDDDDFDYLYDIQTAEGFTTLIWTI